VHWPLDPALQEPSFLLEVWKHGVFLSRLVQSLTGTTAHGERPFRWRQSELASKSVRAGRFTGGVGA
jgi:hypothetical protein